MYNCLIFKNLFFYSHWTVKKFGFLRVGCGLEKTTRFGRGVRSGCRQEEGFGSSWPGRGGEADEKKLFLRNKSIIILK